MNILQNILKVAKRQYGLALAVILLFSSFMIEKEKYINSFPFYDGFEQQNGLYQINAGPFSKAIIDTSAVNTGSMGFIMKGKKQNTYWVDSAGFTTELNAWKANFQNISSVTFFVDATWIANLTMKFDLKQTYGNKSRDCWFRVLVNGKAVKDINGESNFRPISRNNVFRKITYDLRVYTVGKLEVTLQACTRTDKDCVMIDNLMLDNPDNISLIEADPF